MPKLTPYDVQIHAGGLIYAVTRYAVSGHTAAQRAMDDFTRELQRMGAEPAGRWTSTAVPAQKP